MMAVRTSSPTPQVHNGPRRPRCDVGALPTRSIKRGGDQYGDAVISTRTRTRTLVVLAVLAFLTAGCGAEEQEPSVEPPEPAASAAADATSSCDISEPSDALEASVTATAEGLDITWSSGGPAGAATALWSVNVQNADYSAAYQVGVKSVGAEVTSFVFDFNETTQVNLTSAEVTADGATADVGWDELPGLEAGDIQWSAVLSHDGEDVASCPDAGADPQNPQKITLART